MDGSCKRHGHAVEDVDEHHLRSRPRPVVHGWPWQHHSAESPCLACFAIEPYRIPCSLEPSTRGTMRGGTSATYAHRTRYTRMGHQEAPRIRKLVSHASARSVMLRPTTYVVRGPHPAHLTRRLAPGSAGCLIFSWPAPPASTMGQVASGQGSDGVSRKRKGKRKRKRKEKKRGRHRPC